MLKLSFRQQVLMGFVTSLILVFVVFLFCFKSIEKLKADQEDVSHTQRVIETANKVQALLLDGETGQRGYIATTREAFLDPYNKSIFKVNAAIQDFKSLTIDNPVQQDNIDTLNRYANLKIAELSAIIEDAKSKGFESARIRMQNGAGKYYMDQVRRVVIRMVSEENRLLILRKESTASAAFQAILAILIGGVIVVVVVMVLFIYIQKTFAQQKKIEEEIKVANIQLGEVLAENEAKNWLLTGTGLLNEKMQGQQTEKELAQSILAEVCKYTQAITGTLYLFNQQDEYLELYAYYAFHNLAVIKKRVKLSEGWLGQVATDLKPAIIKGTLNDKLELETSIISQELAEIMIVPFFFDKKLKGVIEIAYQNQIGSTINDYILATANDIGIAINTAQARTIMHNLFEETQQQAEELEAQQEEMRVTNEELLNKTEMLQASEEELRVQQEELRTINAELEEKASLLEEKNQAIEEARAAINLKVDELETTGKYKSEFLANMSHELRTPLNSILVLARILKDNKSANLSNDQIKYASVIFNAGNDLLTLINDILDLSKIESGKLEMVNENIEVKAIVNDMEMLFAEMAINKKIAFKSTIVDVPAQIFTDKMRVEQVLKNLLSNAFKFTPEHGAINIAVSAGDASKTISFTIKDTGIGIAPDKQKLIFDAFQQADGSTSRKYGGTGLGLSISRELAALLGGKITVKSQQGQGSEFTLTIPLEAIVNPNQEESVPTVDTFIPVKAFLKPASQIERKDPQAQALVVIVEDDKNFADILMDYAREHGYKAIVVNEGTHAVEIIKENQPDAVILDIMLPGKDGWQILKELKAFPETSAIPVHLMSAGEAAANKVRKEGAISFMKKPIDTGTLDKLFGEMATQSGVAFKQILLVEDHLAQSEALREMMEKQGITVDQAFDGASAFEKLQQNEYQCVILDLNLPDISGLDLLDKIKAIDKFTSLPVVINTAMELDKSSVSRLMQYANAMVVKTSKSSDRLIDEVNLFLHKISNGPQPASSTNSKPNPVSKGKEKLKGKKVLVVDDDMRNIFALTSALQTYDLLVEIANDGEEAISKLEEHTDIDIVLMDIMMPKMDGYEATKYIRKQNKWAKLPVIALTAKAMRDDREKCIAAGANDYITKPVDMDRLISLMQLWLGE